MPFVKALPEDCAAHAVWALHPAAYDAWPDLINAVMRGSSELSDGEKELIGAYASALKGCTHCYTAHYPVAVAYGVDAAFFEDVMQDPATAPVDEKLKPLLIYVRKLVTDPNRLVQKDVDPIFEAGWSTQTLTDVVFICAAFAFMNTIMMGHGAHDADLSDLGPVHAIVRTRGKYGHGEGTGRSDPSVLLKESIDKYGEEATMKAIKRAAELGIVKN